MTFKRILGGILLVFGILFLLTAVNTAKMSYQPFMTWETFKYYAIGFALAIPGALILVPTFSYGRLLNPTLTNFPEIAGVLIKSIKYAPSTKYYSGFDSTGKHVGGSYDRKNWFITLQNSNSQQAHATLNFALVNGRGVTQHKSTLHYNLDPRETIEQRLDIYGNLDKNEGETIILKSITVMVGMETKTHELNQKIGRAGNDPSRKIVLVAVILVIFYALWRSGLFG